MRNKIGIWMMAVLLFFQSAVPVHAAPDDNSVVRAISGYCLGDELYTFIRINEGYDVAHFTAGLQSDAVYAAGEQSLVPVTETNGIVRYVFMIDATGSMRKYADEVKGFVDSLMEAEKQEAFYTVAVFGERFEVVSENMTDKNAVQKVLDELKYTEQTTDPYTGVERALAYLGGYSRKSGDLIHLVVITDGDPDLGIGEEEESGTSERALAESAAQKIAGTPEVVVSTICMAEWDTLAFQAFSAGSGIHETIGDAQDADAAGEKMADYADGLYQISFRLSAAPDDGRFSVKLELRGNDLNGQRAMFDVFLEEVPNLGLFSGSLQDEPGKGKEEGDGEADIGGISGSEVDRENADEEGTKTADGEGTAQENKDTDKAGQDEDMKKMPETDKRLFLTGAVAAVVIVAGICALFLTNKRRDGKAKKQMEAAGRIAEGAAAAGGITMRLEVYAGNCMSSSALIGLTDSLVIGSDSKCDLIFQDADVAPVNSRVFVKNQMIYIEDLNSLRGTALGGMRIQGQNRLRSGDVISIGNVEFSFKF